MFHEERPIPPDIESAPPPPHSHDPLNQTTSPPPHSHDQTTSPPQSRSWFKGVLGFCFTSAADGPLDVESAHPPPDSHDPQRESDLSGHILGFCFASVLGLMVLYFQGGKPLPPLVHLYALATVCAFATIFLAKFIRQRQANLSEVLKTMGHAFAAIALFLGITVFSPFWLGIIYWSIFLCALLAIFKYAPVPQR